MQIRNIRATFGKLEQAELSLRPGLNVIYAPNESGKSTWTAVIRNMLYGISTRDRGELADKNRYAPWSGAAMTGRMELEVNGAGYTLLRQTRRTNAPMGEFSCTYTGTAEPVPGITGQNAGETLLGVSRDVFERSALIAQSALAVEQSAELERRIAALITTGDEETSYSETYERLKKQLNRRKHNKTGQIPALEREIARLDEELSELRALQAQYQSAAEQVSLCTRRRAELQQQQALWERAEQLRQWETFHQAEQEAAAAQERLEALTALSGALPDEAALAHLESEQAALLAADHQLEQAQAEQNSAAQRREEAARAWKAHPLYPADEASVRRQCEAELPAAPSGTPLLLCAAACAAAAIAAAVLFFLQLPTLAAIAAGGFILAGAGTVLLRQKRRRALAAQQAAAAQRDTLRRRAEEYLPLLHGAAEARADADAGRKVAQTLLLRRQEEAEKLLDSLRAYRPGVGDEDVPGTLAELRRQTAAAAAARQTYQALAMRRDMMRQHLPPEPDGGAAAAPTVPRAQIEADLPQATADLHAAQSRLDTLAGQIRSMGDPDDLISRRDRRAEELAERQREYDAIALAMETLDNANLTLQNRFSPELGKRAAEIFADITGGKYQKVLLNRDFSLFAEPSSDAVMRSVQLLSQGAADQLYLAVRLAICDLVLPPEYSAPLVMDDALVSFDDERLHAALEYLVREGARRQILLFTCQKRETAYLQGREQVTLLTL